jgi:hypothetical protein
LNRSTIKPVKPADRFGLLAGLNRSTIKPVKPAGSGSSVFKTLP